MSTEWASARNLLCIRLDNMGDVLMTTPAMKALRESAPGRRLTLLASASGTALAPHLDCVDPSGRSDVREDSSESCFDAAAYPGAGLRAC